MIRRIGIGFVLGAAALVAFASGAQAGNTTLTSKQVMITFTITPSPVPSSGYLPSPVVPALVGRIAALFGFATPAPEPVAAAQYAAFHAPLEPIMAPATQQGNTPVAINVKTDPTGTYLHIVQNNTSLTAVYGTNTYSCPFAIYGYWTSGWHVQDWVNGTATSGTGTFPGYNTPVGSDLAWEVETVSTNWTPFYNAGTPGELTFNGPSGSAKQYCIDLQLTVPNAIAPGVYQIPLNYQLIVGS